MPGTYPRWVSAPLINFRASPAVPLRLTPQISLVPVDAELRATLNGQGLLDYGLNQVSTLVRLQQPVGWALDAECDSGSTGAFPDSAVAFNAFMTVVNCMRAFNASNVDFPILLESRERAYPPGSGTPNQWFPGTGAWMHSHNRPYELEQSDRARLAELCTKAFRILDSDPHGSVSIVLHRIGTANQSALNTDRIIDSTIALEALLVADGRPEIRYRQALRGARLLGDTPEERVALFRLLKAAYDKRSQIVHGGSDDPGPPTADEIVALASRVTRRFIEALGTKTQSGLLDELDEASVRSG